MPKHFYGYKKDPEDPRDFSFALIEAVPLPSSVDLRNLTTKVRDQGNLGSCTAFAIGVGMREFLTVKEGKYTTKYSPLYLYYKERELEGTIDEDSGAYPRDGFKVLRKGCCRESYWPYIISKFTTKPSATAEKNAGLARYKIGSYYRINNLQDLKVCLASGYGAVLGFDVYSSFEDIGADGKMPMPKPGEQILGGHAVFCVGYKDDESWDGGGYLIVKNSWGAEWGDKGFFYMPYAFVTKENVSDIWTARL